MGFNIILNSFIIFFTIIGFHVIIWRAIKPRKHIITLFGFFILLPFLFFVMIIFVRVYSGMGIQDITLTSLLYFALAGVYIQTYPAVQGWSPSLKLVYLIGTAEKGMGPDMLSTSFNDNILIKGHLDNLECEKFVKISKVDNKISLTLKGLIMVSAFILYRRLIGLEEGEG